MTFRNFATALLCLLALAAAVPATAQGGNKKLMSVNAAKTDAQRGILESIVGLKVKSDSVVRDMVAERFQIDAKTSGVVKDIEFADIVYDPEKDIAKAVARIKVGSVINVIGKRVNYGDAIIERIGFGTSTSENAGALQALRAAQIHAYQQLAEKIVGLHIDSNTTVENFILTNDDVKASVLAAIWGAKINDFGWDASGDAFVKMSLKANYVRDVLGQVFKGDQPEITVEGTGTSKDNFSEANKPSGSTEVREQSLGVPVSGSPQKQDLGGAATP